MAAAEVTYADVKLPRSKVKADNRLSPEVTYSEVRHLRKLTEDFQLFDSSDVRETQPRRQMKPRLTAERVALLVLSILLAAAIIALSVTLSHPSCSPKPPTCPPPPAVKNLTCLKCEAGWEQHGGNCYYFSTNKTSWNDSKDSCTDQGSDLVKIDSKEEQMFLKESLRKQRLNETEMFWIGLTGSVEQNSWFWVDESPLIESLSFWSEDQHGRDETDEGQDCVMMGKKRKYEKKRNYLNNWFNKSCDETNRSICEKAANVSEWFCL